MCCRMKAAAAVAAPLATHPNATQFSNKFIRQNVVGKLFSVQNRTFASYTPTKDPIHTFNLLLPYSSPLPFSIATPPLPLQQPLPQQTVHRLPNLWGLAIQHYLRLFEIPSRIYTATGGRVS
ncbi:hypothetical protein BDZ91DRAFT_274826 [Kalaharituber pfeilii]|nr:hypothetical protein BDZ91DRAFT_274826 [Kalaharituber pfeilii]